MVIGNGRRIDDLHRNGYKIIQDKRLFCFGQDAVLLSAFAKAKKGERVLDLCTGNGIIPILMSAKNNCDCYEGLDILSESVELAKQSVELNKLCDKINITEGDLNEADKIYKHGYFDVITVNPPYMNKNVGGVNPSDELAVARHEIKCTLYGIISISAKLLRFGGRFYMIHRPGRLCDIFYYMRQEKIEPKKIRMVCPKKGKEPTMVLIEGIRGGNPYLKTLPELIIYNDEGTYTNEVMDIYYG